MEVDRPLPSSPETERVVLGAIILDNSLLDEARRCCPPSWFYTSSYHRIFLVMLALAEADKEINPIMLAEELRRDDSLEIVGGVLFLTSLTYGLPHTTSLKSFIGILKRHAHRRRLIKFADKLSARAFDDSNEDDALLGFAADQIDKLRRSEAGGRKPQTLEEIGDDQVYRYDRFSDGITDVLPTGFNEIDRHLPGGGLAPNALYVLAAPTSMGKTSLALDILANVGDTGHRVYMVSREMPREALLDRLVAVEADVARWKIRPGIFKQEYEEITKAVMRLALKPIILDDVSLNVADIRGYLKDYQRRDLPVEMLVVDYIQLLSGTRKETRNQEVGSISRGLKGLAMEFKIPVIALSQLKRIGGREPELDDLRDSGEIEQDADAVLFLYGERPEEHMTFYDRTLKCAKQREGPLFFESLHFNGELVTYRRPRVELTGDVS